MRKTSAKQGAGELSCTRPQQELAYSWWDL